MSDESINRYGYKVLTAGIRLGNFLANPVMTYNHFYGGVYAQPIGKWDIRIEGDKLIGTPIFDEVTQLSKDCKARWEAATLNAASIGFNIITTSDDSKYISQGQSRSTVTQCELIEVALVDVPANANAIRLNINFNNESEGQVTDVPLLKQEVKMDLSKVALSLGLAADAS
ncbi:MAG: HK97 family phage prohead protease, partial [Culicoidibacterales bacterium]